MNIATKIYAGHEVLRVEVGDHNDELEIWNWRIASLLAKSPVDLAGPGLYAVCYQDKLVYVGKFRGAKLEPFSGDVALSRWWAHVASLTMRGHRVSIPRVTRGAFVRGTLRPLLTKSLHLALTRASSTISVDRGCVTSVNRVLFANRHWHRFHVANPHDVLGDFSFVYVRARQCDSGLLTSHIRHAVSEAERSAISALHPIANREVPWLETRRQATRENVVAVLELALRRAMAKTGKRRNLDACAPGGVSHDTSAPA